MLPAQLRTAAVRVGTSNERLGGKSCCALCIPHGATSFSYEFRYAFPGVRDCRCYFQQAAQCKPHAPPMAKEVQEELLRVVVISARGADWIIPSLPAADAGAAWARQAVYKVRTNESSGSGRRIVPLRQPTAAELDTASPSAVAAAAGKAAAGDKRNSTQGTEIPTPSAGDHLVMVCMERCLQKPIISNGFVCKDQCMAQMCLARRLCSTAVCLRYCTPVELREERQLQQVHTTVYSLQY